jgi:hypothetical protein
VGSRFAVVPSRGRVSAKRAVHEIVAGDEVAHRLRRQLCDGVAAADLLVMVVPGQASVRIVIGNGRSPLLCSGRTAGGVGCVTVFFLQAERRNLLRSRFMGKRGSGGISKIPWLMFTR